MTLFSTTQKIGILSLRTGLKSFIAFQTNILLLLLFRCGDRGTKPILRTIQDRKKPIHVFFSKLLRSDTTEH